MKTNRISAEEIRSSAQFILNKGRLVHERIDRIVKEIMISYDASLVNMTLAQIEVILTVHRQGALSLKDLSSVLKVSSPAASVMVDKLVEKGYLLRERSKEDRRKVLITSSDKINSHMEAIDKAILEMFEDIISKLGTEMTEKWKDVLSTIEASLDTLPSETILPLEN